MILIQVENKELQKTFDRMPKNIYSKLPCYRSTESEVEKLLLKGPTVFHNHATIKNYLIFDKSDPVGRFTFIQDKNLSEYVQVSFFEILPDINPVYSLIKKEAIKQFPNIKKIVIGLNGHLNYGAGFLRDSFDEIPVFGLPYSPPYYHNHFKNLKEHPLVSFRFEYEKIGRWIEKKGYKINLCDITTRPMNKKKYKRGMQTIRRT